MGYQQDKFRQAMFAVDGYDPGRKLFDLDNHQLGFGAICDPVGGAGDELANNVKQLLDIDFPVGTTMQFLLYASPDIATTVARMRRTVRNCQDPMLRKTIQNRIEFLKNATMAPVEQVSGNRVRDSRLLITVSLPKGRRHPSEAERDAAVQLSETFFQALKTAGINNAPLSANTYLRFMETLLNARPTADWRQHDHPVYDPERPLFDQILDADNPIDDNGDHLVLGEQRVVRILSVKGYPEDEGVHFGQAMNYLSDYAFGRGGIPGNVLMSFNLIYQDTDSHRAKYDRQQAFAVQQASTPIARMRPEYGRRAKALTNMMETLRKGDRVVKGYFCIALIDDDDRASRAALTHAKSYFNNLRFRMMPDTCAVRPLFAQMLPFVVDKGMDRFIGKYKTYATSHVVPMLPIMATWRGTGTPALTLVGRDGQLMTFSPYDSSTNYNMAVAALSGSGKSYLTNAITSAFLAAGAQVRIIDVGGSYTNLCEQMGGQRMGFEQGQHICLNPFERVVDFKDEVDMLAGMIVAMAAPNQALSDLQLSGVKKALTECWEAHGKAMTIDHVAAWFLDQKDQRMTDVGQQLFSFTSKGEYGDYFNGPNSYNPDNNFLLLELDGLESRKHLQTVVLLMLAYQISQEQARGPKDQYKLMIMDEAWAMLARGDMKSFIEKLYRRARKSNGSTITITQSLYDYWSNEGAIAIIENCATNLLLAHRGETIDNLEKDGRLSSLGAYGTHLLRTVKTVPGQYSEILVSTEQGGLGVGRLIVDPQSHLLYSTNPTDRAAIDRYRKQGMATMDAIDAVIRDRQHNSEAA